MPVKMRKRCCRTKVSVCVCVRELRSVIEHVVDVTFLSEKRMKKNKTIAIQVIVSIQKILVLRKKHGHVHRF